ncbi:MAG TPA: C39 family peptidase [Burkholderiales bacterium]|nr:C39 family peptidase [Burkholderiales bacterium]
MTRAAAFPLLLAAGIALCPGLCQAATADLPVEIGGGFSVPVASLKETMARYRFRSTVHQKFDYSCGSAALATLLTYHYETPTTEEETIRAMLIGGDQTKIQREGFSLLDIKNYLEARGFRADGFEATLEQIIEFGAPGIALIQDNGYRHFVVIKGVHDGKVLVGDPALGARVLRRAEFERLWVNHVFFVIHSHRKVARFNVAAQWQVAPSAVLGDALSRQSLSTMMLMRLDPATHF